MKKSDFIKLIREVVRQELKKEIPNALAQYFTQMAGKTQRPTVHTMNTVRYIDRPADVRGQELPHEPSTEEMPNDVPDEVEEMASLKAQLREMMNDGAPIQRAKPPMQAQPAPQPKRFTSNPVLNEILNQTRPFSGQERMANRVGGGGAAMMSPGVAMAAAAYSAPAAASTGVGELMRGEELGFMKNVPGMPGADGPVLTELPTHAQLPLNESSAPMEGMVVDSALDLKNHPALPDSIKNILSRDYRSLVRAMDKGKKK